MTTAPGRTPMQTGGPGSNPDGRIDAELPVVANQEGFDTRKDTACLQSAAQLALARSAAP